MVGIHNGQLVEYIYVLEDRGTYTYYKTLHELIRVFNKLVHVYRVKEYEVATLLLEQGEYKQCRFGAFSKPLNIRIFYILNNGKF